MNEKIIQHNQKIYQMFKEKIEQDDFRWYSVVHYFKCVQCGGYATSMNFLFFGKDYERVLCYKCQQK